MKITVHIPNPRADALDRIAAKKFAGNRSAAVDAALDSLFAEHGELPGTPHEDAWARAQAVIELLKPEGAIAAFDGVLATAAQARAAVVGEGRPA